MTVLSPLSRLVEVLDKGKAAAVTVSVETKDKSTGTVIFENQSTVFIRGAGGFGGKRTGKGKGPVYSFPEATECTHVCINRPRRTDVFEHAPSAQA